MRLEILDARDELAVFSRKEQGMRLKMLGTRDMLAVFSQQFSVGRRRLVLEFF